MAASKSKTSSKDPGNLILEARRWIIIRVASHELTGQPELTHRKRQNKATSKENCMD